MIVNMMRLTIMTVILMIVSGWELSPTKIDECYHNRNSIASCYCATKNHVFVL